MTERKTERKREGERERERKREQESTIAVITVEPMVQ